MHVRGRRGPVALALAAVTVGLAAACSDAGTDAQPPATKNVEAGAPDAPAPPRPLCEDGKPTSDYPAGPYEVALTKTLPPELAWDGPDGRVRIKDYYEPCAPSSRLLVVRTGAAWCGSCLWHATHTKRLFGDARYASRLLLLDLVVADRDNMPVTAAAAAEWKAQIDAPGKVAMDSEYTLKSVLSGRSALPEYVYVDTKTMIVTSVDADPDPDLFTNKVLLELALLDRQPRPPAVETTRYDDLLTENEWDMVRDMRLVAAPPPDPTNEYGDLADAAAFGKVLFEDKGLSPSGTVACASCHDASRAFADATAQSTGVGRMDRNSPSVVMAAHARWQFWDGRADTLWMQALGPPESAVEMGSSRLFIAHQIASRHAATYTAIFGSKYPLPDLTGVPPAGKPGDPAYDALPAATKDAVTRIYVNVGKSLAAFERSLRVKPNALDRYAGGDKTALGDAEKRALQAYFKLGCAQCHWGPNLTDDAFHALRFPTGRQDKAGDRGRFDVLSTLAAQEFVASSKWSDAPAAAKLLVLPAAPSMIGAFKTPSLRGVAESAPYGHGGTMKELADVARHYGERGDAVAANEAAGTVEEWVPSFDVNVQRELPNILRVLKADLAP